MSQRVLRLIGYWQDPSVPEMWPDVRDFVDSGVEPEQRVVVASFLRSGTVFVAAAGLSTCRICGMVNGSTELTDGKYFVWPQGLAHYVEAHDVRLPDDVMAVAERGPAGPVDPVEVERALFETHELTVDENWWRTVRGRPGMLSELRLVEKVARRAVVDLRVDVDAEGVVLQAP